MSIHSHAIVEVFEEILNENLCNGLSREVNFIQRSSSKLKGSEFIKALIIPSEGVSEDSLIGLCMRIREYNPDADLSPQALCERINSPASALLIKEVFTRILYHSRKKMLSLSVHLEKALSKFNSVKIQDSTVMELNKKIYKFEGSHRSKDDAQKSQVKIDLIHELLHNQMIDIDIKSGKIPDQASSARILKFVEKGDLILRDLGYFVLPVLQAIASKEAFFLTRLLPNVKVYLHKEDIKPLDLAKYASKHCKNDSPIDVEVYIGDVRLPVRLVLYRAPKQVIRVRHVNAKRRIKDTGRKLSSGKRFTINYSAFVTNVPKEMLEAELIGTIYQLRWEIELIFKQWKSQLKMNVLKGINVNRIECLIWGRLCMVLLLALISREFGKLADTNSRELSIVKMIKYCMRMQKLANAIRQDKIEPFLNDMEKDCLRMLCKDIRRRKTMRGRVIEGYGYYEAERVDNQYVA